MREFIQMVNNVLMSKKVTPEGNAKISSIGYYCTFVLAAIAASSSSVYRLELARCSIVVILALINDWAERMRFLSTPSLKLLLQPWL